MMEDNVPGINETHNLFLHRVLDNQQAHSVTFMKLDSHKTLYRQGVEAKYLTNLVIAGRNYIEVFAVFQKQITLSMGNWHIYEDITGIYQWDKVIVIATEKKIIGLIYEDCIFKNSFMLSLQFLDLGYKEHIKIVCDRIGQYMVIVSARQILFCVSQKAVQKYKAKPFYHRNSVIVQQDIKWNRPQFQQISDIIKFDFSDFQLSKVEHLHFCQQQLYFLGHSSKSNHEKYLYYIPISKIFSDDENQQLILNLSQQPKQKRQIYPIRRGAQWQFVIVKEDNNVQVQNKNGIIYIQKQLCKDIPYQYLNLHKTNSVNLFPLYLLQDNCIHVYDRLPSGTQVGLSLPSHFMKRQMKLPQNLDILNYDVKQNLFAYCNLYEVGLVFLGADSAINKAHQTQEHQMQEQGVKNNQIQNMGEKIILKQSFGRIIDFNISAGIKSILIIENYHKNLCRIHQLRRGIAEDPRPFITHAKKKYLESIPGIKSIRGLQNLIKQEIQDAIAIGQDLQKVKNVLNDYYVISRWDDERKDNILELVRQMEGHKYQAIFNGFDYYTLVMGDYGFSQNGDKSCTLLFWYRQSNTIQLYSIIPNEQNPQKQLVLRKTIPQIELLRSHSQMRVKKINDYLISIKQQQRKINFCSLKNFTTFSIVLELEDDKQLFSNSKSATMMSLNKKNITFKKKDKDFFILQALVIVNGTKLFIFQISVEAQLYRVSHRSEEIGQGLPILLPSSSPNLVHPQSLFNHKLRSFFCPQYVIPKQNMEIYKSPQILQMHTYEDGGISYLFLINSNKELLIYKKLYSSNSNVYSIFSSSETGFFYHRQTLPLTLLTKFKYIASNNFKEIGCGILRISNLAFYKGSILQIPEQIVSCFQMQGQIWALNSNGKIRMLIANGKVMSHSYLCTTIDTSIKSDILGVQSTNQYYIIYSRGGFEVFDKQLNLHWNPQKSNPQLSAQSSKQVILAVCAFDHYLAVSYYNYCENVQNPSEYQSIKFKLRLYNTITKNKIMQKNKSFEQPVLFIKYMAPDKLILVTPSNIFCNIIKNDRGLENFRNWNYTKKTMLSSFSYLPEKIGVEPGVMIFGGMYGGISLVEGKWIELGSISHGWFDHLRCGIRNTQIFRYEGKSNMLLVTDCDGNLIVFHLNTHKADKIVDYHLGSQANSVKKRNQQPFIASDDGCIRRIIPIKLKDYDISLIGLEEQICKEVPFMGGLNTRDSRCLQQRERTYKITSKGNMVDGQLMQDFMALSETLRNHILDKAQMSVEELRQQLLNYLLI